jgi:hypothetical protein
MLLPQYRERASFRNVVNSFLFRQWKASTENTPILEHFKIHVYISTFLILCGISNTFPDKFRRGSTVHFKRGHFRVSAFLTATVSM